MTPSTDSKLKQIHTGDAVGGPAPSRFFAALVELQILIPMVRVLTKVTSLSQSFSEPPSFVTST